MKVAHIELLEPSGTDPIQSWLDEHPTVVIERIITSGFHFYIFYTE